MKIDIKIGQKFNMLTVLEELPNQGNGRVLRCKCECGNVKNILISHLRRSLIKSCGCHRRNIATKHGMHNSREYSSWENMIQRCTNQKDRSYYLYGGRGIKICDNWIKSFADFYKDMGPRPKNTSLDRKDSNLGYYKENCKWSNCREQALNLSKYSCKVKYAGVTKSVDEWLKDLNIKMDTFKHRLNRGFGFKDAIFNNVDIIVFDTVNKQSIIYNLNRFLDETKFDKNTILNLLDSNHKDPYFNYILRYLIDFKGWNQNT